MYQAIGLSDRYRTFTATIDAPAGSGAKPDWGSGAKPQETK